VVGPKAALLRDAFSVHGVNWLAGQGLDPDGMDVAVKLRNTQPPLAARIFPGDQSGWLQVVLANPEAAVSPGQACVIYVGDRIFGGGWIARPEQERPHNLRRAPIAASV
jgi:tRNA-specific 2-thiouridylase